MEVSEVPLASLRKEVILGFLVRMLRVLGLLLEPFVPDLAARLNYLLGLGHLRLPAPYPQLRHLQPFLLDCLAQSTGLKDPIPLVS